MQFQQLEQHRRTAAKCGGAILGCALVALGCALPWGRAPEPAATTRTVAGPAPSADEAYCAWFADARGDTLYFGLSPFWAAMGGADGDPEADLLIPGPQPIGRFDLAREALLPPLDVTIPDARGGVWDVLAHPNGRVYFTTFFGPMGFVDPATGESRRFPDAGLGLNELALGPGNEVLVTRYGYAADRYGAVLVLDEEGGIVAEHRLADPPGGRAAAKSLDFDPVRREIWVNVDLLPDDPDDDIAYDARVLAWDSGQELVRFREPELQFMRFAPDGTGYFVEYAEPQLRLRIRSPEAAARGPLFGRWVGLDDAFPGKADFAQDLRIHAGPDGDEAWVTRWGGTVHRVSADGEVRETRLPVQGSPEGADGGLYYTAVPRGDRVCASLCAGVRIVCDAAP